MRDESNLSRVSASSACVADANCRITNHQQPRLDATVYDTHVYVAVLVETSQAFEGRFNVFGRNVSYFLGFQDTHQPPVAVAVVHQKQTVTLDDIGLAFHGRCEAVEGIDQVKVDGFVRDGQRRGTVVIVHVVISILPVRVVFQDRMLFVRGVTYVRMVGVFCSVNLIAKVVGVLSDRTADRAVVSGLHGEEAVVQRDAVSRILAIKG